jgi:hypothetical protein
MTKNLCLLIFTLLFSCGKENKCDDNCRKMWDNFEFKDKYNVFLKENHCVEINTFTIDPSDNIIKPSGITYFIYDSLTKKVLLLFKDPDLNFYNNVTSIEYKNNFPIQINVSDDSPYSQIIKYTIDSSSKMITQTYYNTKFKLNNIDTSNFDHIVNNYYDYEGNKTKEIYYNRNRDTIITNFNYKDGKILNEEKSSSVNDKSKKIYNYNKEYLYLIEEFKSNKIISRSFVNNKQLIDSTIYYSNLGYISKKEVYKYNINCDINIYKKVPRLP